LLYFVVGNVSLSFDFLYFVSLVVSDEVTEDDEWSRLVWLWLLFWLFVVEELDEVEDGGLAFLLPRFRERARAVAIGKSSMLWLLDVVTDLGFDEDGEVVDTEGFVEVLFFWLFFGLSFKGGDEAVGDCTGEEESEEEKESPREDSPDRLLSRVHFKLTFEHTAGSRGPVWPLPGPPRREGAVEVDVPELFVEDNFWLDGLRDGSEDGNLFD